MTFGNKLDPSFDRGNADNITTALEGEVPDLLSDVSLVVYWHCLCAHSRCSSKWYPAATFGSSHVAVAAAGKSSGGLAAPRTLQCVLLMGRSSIAPSAVFKSSLCLLPVVNMSFPERYFWGLAVSVLRLYWKNPSLIRNSPERLMSFYRYYASCWDVGVLSGLGSRDWA